MSLVFIVEIFLRGNILTKTIEDMRNQTKKTLAIVLVSMFGAFGCETSATLDQIEVDRIANEINDSVSATGGDGAGEIDRDKPSDFD